MVAEPTIRLTALAAQADLDLALVSKSLSFRRAVSCEPWAVRGTWDEPCQRLRLAAISPQSGAQHRDPRLLHSFRLSITQSNALGLLGQIESASILAI